MPLNKEAKQNKTLHIQGILGGILPMLPTRQDLKQVFFYCVGFRKWGSGTGQDSFLLDYDGHRLTGCNVNQRTLLRLGLAKYNVSPACIPAHK